MVDSTDVLNAEKHETGSFEGYPEGSDGESSLDRTTLGVYKVTYLAQDLADAAKGDKLQVQNDAASRLRKMLFTVETKLRTSGSPVPVASEPTSPRARLVDDRGNCLLGCGGKCKCLSYPRVPPDDDESDDDLYLMSGALGSEVNSRRSARSSSAVSNEDGGPHEPDGDLCIRDKPTPRRGDMAGKTSLG
ncbi:hypothetical protein LTR78_000005 [Recurvomyces mirabilis]|uniref:Uncharacterized protein n=1 Tax=Recurvomyces mirabilis TaxID=574656 RepID=A0AAE0WXS4_9PEZI|nr:hypothetical protein LTR78_000005 [Recurvomyces mirabilis]KAK5161662.1 hypothetical protein LTS14_000006 [Recurvomyces mirabilis]